MTGEEVLDASAIAALGEDQSLYNGDRLERRSAVLMTIGGECFRLDEGATTRPILKGTLATPRRQDDELSQGRSRAGYSSPFGVTATRAT